MSKVAENEVRRWAHRAREATTYRDQWIRTMRADGASLRAIAEVAGLSHMAISKIVAKGD